MKYLLFTLLLCSIFSCAVQKTNRTSEFKDSFVENDTIRIANDSLEYEIIIYEPGFNSWLATQRPRGFYSINYLEQKNMFFVTTYNIRANNPIRYSTNLYPQPINYEFNVDYGYEVNYLLFNYFLFFQERYRQRLR